MVIFSKFLITTNEELVLFLLPSIPVVIGIKWCMLFVIKKIDTREMYVIPKDPWLD